MTCVSLEWIFNLNEYASFLAIIVELWIQFRKKITISTQCNKLIEMFQNKYLKKINFLRSTQKAYYPHEHESNFDNELINKTNLTILSL